jgi:hypothetical protein
MNQNVDFSSLLARVTAVVVGTVLALMAMLIVVGALMLGIVFASGSVLWALLRGRRPGPVNLRWGAARRARAPWRPPARDVVDVLAREVKQPPLH